MRIWKHHVRLNFHQLLQAPSNIQRWAASRYFLFRLTLKSLFYNELANNSYILEVLMEPMVWVVDHFTKALGPILVFLVVILTGSVIAIVYIIGLPYYWMHYPRLTWLLMGIGHWLLVNVVFHYYMATTTDPGTLVKDILVSEAVSVCKKCIAPKPPRTHHCSVCHRCILKMDHHCPWLNQCVGHYNHRYFYLYMVYMSAGALFIILFGYQIAYHEVWVGGESGVSLRDAVYSYWNSFWKQEKDEGERLSGYPVRVNGTHMIPVINGTPGSPVLLEPPPTADPAEQGTHTWYRFSIMYCGAVTSGALISLAGLSIWHGRLISRGETSIEAHINKKERERLLKINQIYRNPYDYGMLQNWRVFLGVTDGRGLRHVLLPSRHAPLGTGLTWPNSILMTASHEKAA